MFNGRFLSPSIGLGSVYDTCRSDGVFTHGMAGSLGISRGFLVHGGWVDVYFGAHMDLARF